VTLGSRRPVEDVIAEINARINSVSREI